MTGVPSPSCRHSHLNSKLAIPRTAFDSRARLLFLEDSRARLLFLELNPDDALIGFLDQPPIQLRRWACYQTLLGKVRHKFKHVLLTEVKGILLLGDAMAVVRKKNGLYLTIQDGTWSDLMLENGTWSDPMLENGIDIGLNNKGSNGVRMQGIFESVYGNQLWTSLDKREKEMKLVNSEVIFGGIQPVRGLANAMKTEIVRVAL